MSTPSDTPETDAEDRPYPSPEHAQRIRFEGNECVVMYPEEYEALYEKARKLERGLNEAMERAQFLSGFEGDLQAIIRTLNAHKYPHHPEYPDDDEIIRRICEMANERDQLRARVEELEKDKERLNWLENLLSARGSLKLIFWDHDGRRFIGDDFVIHKFKARGGEDETLRQSIDEARKGQQ